MLYAYKFAAPKPRRRVLKAIPVFFILAGAVLLGVAVFPIIFFQLTYQVSSPGLLSPSNGQTPGLISYVQAFDQKDYNNALNWFDDSKYSDTLLPSEATSFQLSIPGLKISKAKVLLGGLDLKKNLIAWPSSVNPGELGSVFIFGHSALPSFYSPSNYTTIFTHLYDLKYGEDIFVDFDGISYQFKVESKKIVKPDDFSVLEQRFDRPRLVLITCLPPGTYALRGVVTAKLVES